MHLIFTLDLPLLKSCEESEKGKGIAKPYN